MSKIKEKILIIVIAVAVLIAVSCRIYEDGSNDRSGYVVSSDNYLTEVVIGSNRYSFVADRNFELGEVLKFHCQGYGKSRRLLQIIW